MALPKRLQPTCQKVLITNGCTCDGTECNAPISESECAALKQKCIDVKQLQIKKEMDMNIITLTNKQIRALRVEPVYMDNLQAQIYQLELELRNLRVLYTKRVSRTSN